MQGDEDWSYIFAVLRNLYGFKRKELQEASEDEVMGYMNRVNDILELHALSSAIGFHGKKRKSGK